jgi:hypothetical protein
MYSVLQPQDGESIPFFFEEGNIFMIPIFETVPGM